MKKVISVNLFLLELPFHFICMIISLHKSASLLLFLSIQITHPRKMDVTTA